ncbi:hypothetical protein BN3456_01487 [Clostridium sp. C105KSO13]|nr:hypothetical protein BN3456_01487 [Clostridium sp. C105KSO13]
MPENLRKTKNIFEIQYGVITLDGVMTLFFATKFNKIIYEQYRKATIRAPPYFDLIFLKFKSEVKKDRLQ